MSALTKDQAAMLLEQALDKAVAKLLAASHHSCSGWQQFGDLTIGALMGIIITIVVGYFLYKRAGFVLQPAAAAGPPAHGGVALGVPQPGFAANAPNAPNAPPGAGWAA